MDSEEYLLCIWEEFFNSTGILLNTEAEAIFTQNILKKLVSFSSEIQEQCGFPAVSDNIVTDAITQKEWSVLRYVAGFVAYKMKKIVLKVPSK